MPFIFPDTGLRCEAMNKKKKMQNEISMFRQESAAMDVMIGFCADSSVTTSCQEKSKNITFHLRIEIVEI